MARHRFWLLIQPGLRGDMTPLYMWLDQQEADEVPGGATFLFNGTVDAVEESLRELNMADNTLRGYCIGRGSNDRWAGRWIWGKRQYASWTGYARSPEHETDEDTEDL